MMRDYNSLEEEFLRKVEASRSEQSTTKVPFADQKPTNPKDILGSSRAPLSLVSGYAEAEEALAMSEGGLKYGLYNYRGIGVRGSIYLDAAFRHLRRWQNGEERDPKTGVHHLGYARACIGIILESIAQGNFTDDRPPAQPAYSRLLDGLESRIKHLKGIFSTYAPKHWTIQDSQESEPNAGQQWDPTAKPTHDAWESEGGGLSGPVKKY